MIRLKRPDTAFVAACAIIAALALAGAVASRYAAEVSATEFKTLIASDIRSKSTWEVLREGPVVGRIVAGTGSATYFIVVPLPGGTLKASILTGRDGEALSGKVIGMSSGTPYAKRLGALVQGLGIAQSAGYSSLDGILEPLLRNSLDTIAFAERDRRGGRP